MTDDPITTMLILKYGSMDNAIEAKKHTAEELTIEEMEVIDTYMMDKVLRSIVMLDRKQND